LVYIKKNMQSSIFSYQFAGLFSENYVEKHFPETDIYKKLKPKDEIRKNIILIFNNNIKTVSKKNEAQLEEDLIKPILKALGIHFIVQVTTSVGEPDYAIFKDEESREKADQRETKRYEGAIALADAKRWGRSLDKSGGTSLDIKPNAVPTRQIANYISETGINWGLLTDGKKWRIFNRNVYPVSQSFFEIDLQSAIEDSELFHLFYAIFSGQAFACEAQNFILNESKNYWSAIGEDLKERSYKALEKLCNGFYANNSELDIKDIYEASVILLYRLLFILNAESRGLFQVEKKKYEHYSLYNILQDVYRKDLNGLSTDLSSIYPRIQTLFQLIDKGDESIGIYRYNGGLFKEEDFPFLPKGFFEKYTVPDRYLAEALILIGYVKEKKGEPLKPVDYRELDVRHLGSIYEGLLEFHPKVEDNKIILYTDKGEKKKTGSYYTPDYIVNYIVEKTLKPVIDKMKTPKELLSLKILDPSMGSGHFLVGAIDYIGRRCVEMAGETSELSEKDYQRLAVEQCIYGVDLNPLAVELAKLSLWLHTIAKNKPISFLDHHLKVGNSLIGAKIADLEELPKNKKQINDNQISIFSIRLNEKMPIIINEVIGILGRATEVIEDVEVKEKLLETAKEHLKPFITVANLWLSKYFGNDINDDECRKALGLLPTPKELYEMDKVKRAEEICYGNENNSGMRFFHWELEFPDVYFDENGNKKKNPSFDVVIGNPPYVDIKGEGYLEIYETKKSANLYAYFLERGITELKSSGLLGMIVPITLVCSSRMTYLREYLKNKCGKTYVTTFAKRPSSIFSNQQRTSIIISEKNEGNFELNTTKYNRWHSGHEIEMIDNLSYVESTKFIKEYGWPKIGDNLSKNISAKISKKNDKLGNFLSGNIEFYYHNIGMYWLNAYTFEPVFKDEDGNIRKSTTLKILKTSSKLLRDIIVSIINSSLFYFFWNIYSDDFHLYKEEIERFPFEFNIDKYGNVYDMLSIKVKELMKSYKDNSFTRTAKIQGKTKIWQEFQPGKSKHILDEIDKLLSGLYGLTNEETEYIIHYDEKFRMSEED